MEDFFARHEKVALSFSAGKDSAACLYLLRPWWDQLTVVWACPGDPFTETLEYMYRIEKMVPHFKMVLGDQRYFAQNYGLAVDAVPFEATEVGAFASKVPAPRLALSADCCGANLWTPLHQHLKDNGYTGVIRGQKRSDRLQGVPDGTKADGVEYFLPIADWTDEDVVVYLGDRIPPSYTRGAKSSLDCRTCLAYGAENPGRMDYLKQHEPEAYDRLNPVAIWLKQTLIQHANNLQV